MIERVVAGFPRVDGLVFGSTACGGSKAVGELLEAAASSAAQRSWRSMGARTMQEAKAALLRMFRVQMSFTAARSHARLRLTRLELIGHSGRAATQYASSGAAANLVTAEEWEMEQGGILGGGGGRVGSRGGWAACLGRRWRRLAGVSRACGAVSEWRSWEGVRGYVWVCVGVLCGCVMCVLEDGLGIRVS